LAHHVAFSSRPRIAAVAPFETPAEKTRAPQGERRFAFQKPWVKSVRPEEPPPLWRRLEGRASDNLPIAGQSRVDQGSAWRFLPVLGFARPFSSSCSCACS